MNFDSVHVQRDIPDAPEPKIRAAPDSAPLVLRFGDILGVLVCQ